MTIQQLQYVKALYIHQHFVKAAESVHISQPTLTMQLKKLEDELGYHIFDRQLKPLKPTAAGQKFIEQTLVVLSDFKSLESLSENHEGQLEGDLKLGIIPTLAPYLLPLFLEKFSQSYPNLKVIVNELQSHVLMESLKRESVDIGLMATPSGDKHLMEQPLFYEPFWFYAAPNHRYMKKKLISPSDLRTEEMWLLEQGHCFREQVLNVCQSDIPKGKIEYQSGSIETVKQLALRGSKYTLVPELALKENEMAFSKPFAEPVPSREVSLVYSKGFQRKKALEALHDCIVNTLPDHFQKQERKRRIKWV